MEKVKITETGTDKGFTFFKSAIGQSQLAISSVLSTFGFIGIPYVGMNAIRSRTGSESVMLGVIQKAIDGMKEGESVMFSKTSEGIKATIYARVDGTLEINGNDDNMVRYNELKKGFDQLKQDHNTLLTELKSHTHGGVTVGQGITTAPSPTLMSLDSTASIDGSKCDTIKTKN